MSNPSKAKGTRAESNVVRTAQMLGIPARRVALAGIHDQGDVHMYDGAIVAEVKVRKKLPSWTQLEGWWRETTEEAARVNGADLQLLIVKRPGSGQAEDWWAYVSLDELHYWIEGTYAPEWMLMRGVPVCVPLGTLLAVIKDGA